MDINVVNQGLTITVLGLFITFLALGVFILLMVVLQKAFPYKEEPVEEGEEEETPAISMAVEAEEGEDLGAVAAIAVAISYLRSRSQSSLGSTLEAGHGSWWMANRMAAHTTANLLKK